MINSAFEFNSLDETGIMNPHYVLYVFCKNFISRKWGSAVRMSCFILLLVGLYISTSFLSSDKIPQLTEDNNETERSLEKLVIIYEKDSIHSRPHILNESVIVQAPIKIGDIVVNCGLPAPCGNGEFPLHIYTGKDHKDEPRLCVDSKYILSKDVNGGGRGINVVVIDNMTKYVTRVGHFDTYEKESIALETLLLTLRPGDILILLTFDEPTRKMSRIARLLLHELGSALIQNLSYRGSWYMVTQKGVTGFSPFEELHLVESCGWPKHHDVKFCVPFHIKGQKIHPDLPTRSNQQRVEFCQKYGDYPLFCDADVINDPLNPASLPKQAPGSTKIYNTPIIVMSGENTQHLPITLETLIRQPGIVPSLVVVYYLPQHGEVPSLCDLVGFMSEELTKTYTYCERVHEAFEVTNLLFPDSKDVIFLAENIVLAPDFLRYMGQLSSLLDRDSSLVSVSAWNENGFKGVSSNTAAVYRVETFSGLAILVHKDIIKKIQCSNDSDGNLFLLAAELEGDSIVPDVSRILPIQIANYLDFDFNTSSSREGIVNYDEKATLKAVDKLHHDEYEKYLDSLIASATSVALETTSITQCIEHRENSDHDVIFDASLFLNWNVTGLSMVVYFHQDDENDLTTLQMLCRCFGLFYHPLYSPRGTYKATLRFTLDGRSVFFVGSTSPFFSHKPTHVLPVGLGDRIRQTEI